ncbi:MAG: RagB/SusD family nutrient uptake outer membrane protein [Mangrovibacterium sp.]
MKNIIFFLSFLLILFMTACEDDLDQVPISYMSAGSFYTTTDEIEDAVNGIYNTLSDYPENEFYLTDVRSDDFYVTPYTGSSVRSWDPISNFETTIATNELVEYPWDNDYTGIMRANTVLNYISTDIVTDQDTYNRLLGETKFLRAFFYFDLVKLYGKVPIIDKLVTGSEALSVGRSSVESVYTLIINDLTDAVDLLPESYSGSDDVGRVTKYAAEGILARVYLMRSGPQLHPDGPCLNSGEYDKALTLLNDIINSGKYEMLDNYGNIFGLNYENSKEIVFDIQFTNGDYGTGGEYPGLINSSSDFWHTIGFSPSIGTESVNVSEDLFAAYDTTSADLRDDFNVIYKWYNATLGVTLVDPVVTKWCLDPNTWGSNYYDFALNFPILRYTDVLMMKAECILQGAAGTQAEVDEIVNKVRERAGLTDISNVTIDQLLEERRKEFFTEGRRWPDLVRTGKVLTVMNAWLAGDEDYLNEMPSSIDYTSIINPVPQDEIDIKEGLYDQNEGYQ